MRHQGNQRVIHPVKIGNAFSNFYSKQPNVMMQLLFRQREIIAAESRKAFDHSCQFERMKRTAVTVRI